jgi:hypothetical protein
MKNYIFLCLLFVCGVQSVEARIWRVNNNPGVAADFTTFAACLAVAVDDDIIHIEPSATPYGLNTSFNITKRLTIIGNGTASNSLALFQNVTFYFGATSSGSKVYGLKFDGSGGASGFSIRGSDIVIQRCYLKDLYLYDPGTNISILENFVALFYKSPTLQVQNLIIKNNIINFGTGISLTTGETGIIENNTISASTALSIIPFSANPISFTITNNIFHSTTQNITGSSYALFRNNISTRNDLPSGNGNLNSVSQGSLFGTDYHLATTSPAKDQGYFGSGDDIGAYNDGTGRPTFVDGSIPPFPTIYSVTGGGTQTGPTMTVTIKTRSNN